MVVHVDRVRVDVVVEARAGFMGLRLRLARAALLLRQSVLLLQARELLLQAGVVEVVRVATGCAATATAAATELCQVF